MPEFRLSCYALVRNENGSILLLQRPNEERIFAGKWELPGGKLEAGETIEAATCREVREETGLHVQLASLAGAVDFALGGFRVVLLVFETAVTCGEALLSPEHQALRWVRPQELAGMDVTEPLGRFLKGYQGPGAIPPRT